MGNKRGETLEELWNVTGIAFMSKTISQTLIGKHYLGPLLFLGHICIRAVLEAEAHLSLPRNFADREICRGEEVKMGDRVA